MLDPAPASGQPDRGVRIDDLHQRGGTQHVAVRQRQCLFKPRAGNRIEHVHRHGHGSRVADRQRELDALPLALAHADDTPAADFQPRLAGPCDRLQFLLLRMRRAKLSEIRRGRLQIAMIAPDAALPQPDELLFRQQPERSAQRNAHLGADPAVNAADAVGLSVAQGPTAGHQREAPHSFGSIVSRLAHGFLLAHQRIDLDIGLVEFRLRAPLAVLAATAAAGVHDRAHVDPASVPAHPDPARQLVQPFVPERLHPLRHLLVARLQAVRHIAFDPVDPIHVRVYLHPIGKGTIFGPNNVRREI